MRQLAILEPSSLVMTARRLTIALMVVGLANLVAMILAMNAMNHLKLI